jgi:hypothetical protein
VNLIHVNNGYHALPAIFAGWMKNIPVVVHLHSDFSRRHRLLRGIHLADRIVGVSGAILERSRADPVAASRLRVIYNGIDELGVPQDRAKARAELGILPDQIVVGTAAFLIAPKRVDVAVQAMKHLPAELAARTVLLVMGDGPERARLEELARGLPVRFMGQRSDVRDLMLAVLDVFVLPSEMEAFSLALLEAAAAGLPRIGVAVGGTPESILHGIDGLIVPPGDPAALAQALTDLAMDRERARVLGEAARVRARQYFSRARFTNEFAQLHAEAIATLPARRQRIIEALRSIRHQIGFKRVRAFAATSDRAS